MNIHRDESLYFFDSTLKYPYLTKRTRKSTESLPKGLQEARRSSLSNLTNKLDAFLYKQKRVPLLSDGQSPRKKNEKKNLDTINEFNVCPKKSKSKNIGKLFVEQSVFDEGLPEPDVEDDGRFLFEEAKFSATSVIFQLGKLLDIVVELLKDPKEKTKTEAESQDSITIRQGNTDIIWKFSSTEGQTIPKQFYPSEAIIDLLSIGYEDLIKNTDYKPREWQSHAYRHILGSAVKPNDSGVFSAPQTAMSSLYLKGDENPPKQAKKNRMRADQPSNINVRATTSKDSGLTTDNEHPVSTKQKDKQGKKGIAKQKTRIEKFNALSKEDTKPKSIDAPQDSTPPKPKKENKDESIEEVPLPPVTQTMINFAISSKVCHEKGWIVQPSFLDDPEHQTLLVWARQRLQQSIRKRMKEEEDSLKMNLKKIIQHFYGDTKRDILTKNKHSVLNASKKGIPERRQTFMITLPDGTQNLFYPSGNLAIVCVSCPDNVGHYILVYSDKNTERKLLAHFTPSGRGVCYHSNGQIAFISMSKMGYCLSEDGALINKWKWSLHKMVPPLSIHLNQNILFRCSNKSSMTLFVNINGESTKFQIGTKDGIPDPKLHEMGHLLTMEKFTSNIAIQLSKSIPKKKESKKIMKPKEKAKMTEEQTEDKSKIPPDILEQRIKELEIKFPEERKDFDSLTPYQVDLKALQKKFKTTASDWLDHYRVATGMAVSNHSRRSKARPFSCSALSLPSSLPAGLRSALLNNRRNSRAPSAPPSGFGKSSPRLVRCTTPFKCGLLQQQPKITKILPKDGCPVALRLQIGGDKNAQCRCDNRKVPTLTDIELDKYLPSLPKTQLLVLSIVSTGFSNPVDAILEKMYKQINKNRSIPCVQSRHDAYRLLKYPIPPKGTANPPLLKKRHNISPGMFMMFQGGKLLFADYIFDGYGSTKKDLLKQISRTRKEALKGQHLPEDFRFATNPISPKTSDVMKGGLVDSFYSGTDSMVEDDTVVEEISSEKIITGSPLKINIILSDELKNAMEEANRVERRKVKSTLSKAPAPSGAPNKVH